MIISKCPVCGGRIIVTYFNQYSLDYRITKCGKISKCYTKHDDSDSNETAIAHCENPDCDGSWEGDEFNITPDGYFDDLKYEKELEE